MSYLVVEQRASASVGETPAPEILPPGRRHESGRRARHRVSTRGSRLRRLSRAARSTTISGSAGASPLGGTLLGAGGLVRAYGDAVRTALDEAGRLRRSLVREHLLVLEHAEAGRVESELRTRGVVVLDAAYGARVSLTLGVPPAGEARLSTLLAELTAGAAETQVAGERWVDSLDP